MDIREVHNTLVWRKGKRIRVELDKQGLPCKFLARGARLHGSWCPQGDMAALSQSVKFSSLTGGEF